MKTISFLASHGGSTTKSVINAINSREIDALTGVVITNNKSSEIVAWCRSNSVEVHHISGKTHPNKQAKYLAIFKALFAVRTDLIILSGYMKKIGLITLSAYENRIFKYSSFIATCSWRQRFSW